MERGGGEEKGKFMKAGGRAGGAVRPCVPVLLLSDTFACYLHVSFSSYLYPSFFSSSSSESLIYLPACCRSLIFAGVEDGDLLSLST